MLNASSSMPTLTPESSLMEFHQQGQVFHSLLVFIRIVNYDYPALLLYPTPVLQQFHVPRTRAEFNCFLEETFPVFSHLTQLSDESHSVVNSPNSFHRSATLHLSPSVKVLPNRLKQKEIKVAFNHYLFTLDQYFQATSLKVKYTGLYTNMLDIVSYIDNHTEDALMSTLIPQSLAHFKQHLFSQFEQRLLTQHTPLCQPDQELSKEAPLKRL